MSEPNWSLQPQLQNDTSPVGDLALSRVLSINAADYSWLILVPRRAGVSEIADLGDDAAQLMAEITQVSRVLKDVTRCDKTTSPRSATSCRSFTSTSPRAARTIRYGRSRFGAPRRRASAIRSHLSALSVLSEAGSDLRLSVSS